MHTVGNTPAKFQTYGTVKFFDRVKPVGTRSYVTKYVVITSPTSKQDLARIVEVVFPGNEKNPLFQKMLTLRKNTVADP